MAGRHLPHHQREKLIIRAGACLSALVICILLNPSEAIAWGPAVHMAIGHHVLGNLSLLPAALGALLSAHPDEFLYGCLSADIFIGKGSAFKPLHSHNWSTGYSLLHRADTPELESYAWGYLSHLAADVIAHNYLVPNMLGYTAGRGKFAHTYAEMLADLHVNRPHKLASRLFGTPRPLPDKTLAATMRQRILPFRIKKHIFRHSLHLAEQRVYRGSLKLFKTLARTRNRDALIRQSIDYATDLVMDLLKNPLHSPVLECDPIGCATLGQARKFRRRQRLYYLAHKEGIIFPLDARLEPCLQSSGEQHGHLSDLPRPAAGSNQRN